MTLAPTNTTVVALNLLRQRHSKLLTEKLDVGTTRLAEDDPVLHAALREQRGELLQATPRGKMGNKEYFLAE